jgi:hypothetical protein
LMSVVLPHQGAVNTPAGHTTMRPNSAQIPGYIPRRVHPERVSEGVSCALPLGGLSTQQLSRTRPGAYSNRGAISKPSYGVPQHTLVRGERHADPRVGRAAGVGGAELKLAGGRSARQPASGRFATSGQRNGRGTLLSTPRSVHRTAAALPSRPAAVAALAGDDQSNGMPTKITVARRI